MKKKYVELLQFLLHHATTVTSRQLAIVLSISTRSVRNYINEIDLLGNQKMILSSKQGYTVRAAQTRELLSVKEESIPQASPERGFYIMKQTMLERSSHMDLCDLCGALCVSYSTIKTDATKMNRVLTDFHIEFICESEEVRLHGSEKNKRRLVSYVMHEETDQQFMDANTITSGFPEFPVEQVSMTIRSTFQKYNYYINDFFFVDLSLRFTIIIDRVKKGNFVKTRDCDLLVKDENERALIEELRSCPGEALSISFNRNEQFRVYMLFKTSANYSLPSSEDSLKKLINENILALTRDIIQRVNDSYYIGLNRKTFLTPFALYLRNLLLRVRNDIYTKNPVVDATRSSRPTVYDIAIFIAMELMQRFHVGINGDEVTFLTLHIDADIERQKANDGKIQCILLCPGYMNMTASVCNKLLTDFGNQINMCKTISYEHGLKHQHYDMLLTTIPLKCPLHKEVCLIPFFLNPNSRVDIQNTIGHYRTNEKNCILKKKFHDFFSSSLLLANGDTPNRDDVLPLPCKSMEGLEYVSEGFLTSIMIRKTATSTAFGSIAISHLMKMEALKTCIGVAISKKGIRQDNHIIHVVLPVALNEIDRQTFHDLYEALVDLFNKEDVMGRMKECTSLEQFEHMMCASISYQEEETVREHVFFSISTVHC